MMYDQARAQQPPDNGRGRGEPRTPVAGPLLPADERAQLNLRLQQALDSDTDSPRQALEAAETAFDEVAAHLVNTLAERRRVLRESWQDQTPEAQSVEFRLALRQYREIAQRLLRL